MFYQRVEEFMNRLEPPSRKDHLGAHKLIARSNKFPEFDLLLRVRREIGMAALGGHGHMLLPVPEKNGLAHARPRGDHDDCGLRHGNAVMDGFKIRRLQDDNSVGSCLEIVEKADAIESEQLRHHRSIHNPRNVRSVDHVVHDSPGDSERRGSDRYRIFMEEFVYDFRKAGMLVARAALVGDEYQLSVPRLE